MHSLTGYATEEAQQKSWVRGTAEKLGFTRVLGGHADILEKVGFHSGSGESGDSGENRVFYDFHVFGGSRSTQPTGFF